MGYPVQIALRYLGSKKRAFVSVGTAFAMLGVALGVAALAIVMSVTGGFQDQFREKVNSLQQQIKHYEEKEEDLASEARQLSTKSQALLDQNIQLKVPFYPLSVFPQTSSWQPPCKSRT